MTRFPTKAALFMGAWFAINAAFWAGRGDYALAFGFVAGPAIAWTIGWFVIRRNAARSNR